MFFGSLMANCPKSWKLNTLFLLHWFADPYHKYDYINFYSRLKFWKLPIFISKLVNFLIFTFSHLFSHGGHVNSKVGKKQKIHGKSTNYSFSNIEINVDWWSIPMSNKQIFKNWSEYLKNQKGYIRYFENSLYQKSIF